MLYVRLRLSGGGVDPPAAPAPLLPLPLLLLFLLLFIVTVFRFRRKRLIRILEGLGGQAGCHMYRALGSRRSLFE